MLGPTRAADALSVAACLAPVAFRDVARVAVGIDLQKKVGDGVLEAPCLAWTGPEVSTVSV